VNKPMGERVTIRLPKKLLKKIERRAEAEGRSLGNLIRRVLELEFEKGAIRK
jgi:predicted DNA binding CopG/RHH family protein